MLANEKPSVLLVEEDEEFARQLSRTFSDSNTFDVVHVPRVAAAEDLLSETHFELILLTLSASDFPGLSAIALTQAAAPATPIILIAHEAEEHVALKGVHQGASDYLIRTHIYDTVLLRTAKHAIEVSHSAQLSAQSEARYRALFEQSRDAIFIADESGCIIESNTAFSELLRCQPSDLVGRTVDSLLVDPADRALLFAETESSRSVTDLELQLKRADGETLWCLMSVTGLAVPGKRRGYQGIIHDISDRKRAEERLLYNAYHDVLTGLPNRALFVDRLERTVVRWRRHRDQSFAVLFIDLNRFKFVNDSLGHSAGDELLRKVGEIISDCLREEDTVARLGGDEYAILLDHIDTRAEAIIVAQRIHTCLESPVLVGEQNVFVSCSVGIALSENTEDRPEDLLRNADLAMYKAKSEGPGRYSIYTEGMHAVAVSTMELDTELNEALRRSEFELHYQPIYAIASGGVSGFEALLRWRNPKRGLLLPQDFLKLAEETGLIMPIGAWVMRRAIEQLAEWEKNAHAKRPPFISLNISGKQLTRSGFAADTAALIREANVDPTNLMFELTETSLLQNPQSCASTISKLRDIGVRFCIDDFGTGYSSLSYLHRLPINGLKIDRSFIAGLDRGNGRELVSTIVSLAHNLGIYAVAEGVETEMQLKAVRSLGPKYVQGFFLSRPLPANAASDMAILAA